MLGRRLREQYVLRNQLVPEDPSDTQVWLKTTTLDRAVQTLQGVVSGRRKGGKAGCQVRGEQGGYVVPEAE